MKRVLMILMTFCSMLAFQQLKAEEFEVWNVDNDTVRETGKLKTDEFGIQIGGQELRLGDYATKLYPDISERDYTSIEMGQLRFKYKIYTFPWGDAYIPNNSSDFTSVIFGIILENDSASLINGISVGDTRNDVVRTLGKPYYVIDNRYIYINDDFDHLEMEFYFSKTDRIEKIELFLGT